MTLARDRTKPALHGGLSTIEYFTFGFGTMIGVGWVVLMDDWLARGGPGGGILGVIIGGFAPFSLTPLFVPPPQRLHDAGARDAVNQSGCPPLRRFAPGVSTGVCY